MIPGVFKRMEGMRKSTYGTMAEGTGDDDWLAACSALRILLVGRSGSGKSATGNSILCRPAFESKLGAQSVTRTCQREMSTWNGRSILVVDTPNIFESKAQNQEMDKDIADCYLLCAPGPHVLLLVTQLGRFTAQDAMAVRRVKEVFGSGATRYMVVLFTHKEDLADECLDDYVAHTENHSLQRLIQECGRRYCAFNNRATGQEQRRQLDEFMALVERLERECGGSFHSNELFFHAQRVWQCGAGAYQQDYRHFLAEVRQQLDKQKQGLEEQERNCALKALLRVRRWMASHVALSAGLIICGLILLALIINLCIIQWK
uniref:GTPase IMAP family member 5-like isoform X1 n=2 Tax=Jaculus jaculus TaxID=51337 RepID=UPI001E1B3D7A|nr:GTPase IMAP family member 5-like isoform X1 [Jaculus jaculus]